MRSTSTPFSKLSSHLRNRLNPLFTKDSANVQGMVVFGVALLFFGAFLTIIGFAIDPLQVASANMNAVGGFPVSQEKVNTVHWLILMFKASAVLCPIGFGISLWSISTRTVPGEV